MKFIRFHFLLFMLLLVPTASQSQDIDTLIDIGAYKLHFTIWKGEGIPILFDSGSGNDGTIWKPFIDPIRKITRAPLITYDRTGYGKSELNPMLADNKKSLISNGIADLDKALQQLGFGKEIMLVSHSFGGLYNTYFANKYPERVKSIVLIDASLECFKTPDYLKEREKEQTEEWLANIKNLSEGLYYECLSHQENIDVMRSIQIPLSIPVIDIVAGSPPTEGNPVDEKRWTTCHEQFVKASPNRIGITGYACGHYVHYENPMLAVQSIAKAYCLANPAADNSDLLSRSLDYGIESSNNYRKKEYDYWHSERDLNNWGYSFLNKEELDKALLALQLNTLLFPESFNVWDSYGEVLLKLGKKKEAIAMYQKSMELNPDNENGKKVLKELMKN